MAKKSEAELLLGFKRICPACNTRYYDMAKMPPTCPHCGVEYNPEALLKSRRNRPIEDEEETKLKPTKARVAEVEDDEVEAPAAAEEEEEAEAEVEYAELDGEAELPPDEEAAEGLGIDDDADDEEDEEDNDVLEDTSDLGEDDALVDVDIAEDREEDR